MSVLGVIQLVLLAGFSFALLVGAVASAGARFLLSGTASWSPERRHRALLLLSIAPLALAAFGVVAVLAPSVVSLIWPEDDHCLSHGAHHLHICLVHLPRDLGNAGSWIVLLLLIGWLSLTAGRASTDLYRAWRCVSQLRGHGEVDATLGANILPTAAPLCILAGIFKPTLFLSRGLLARVEPEQIAVIVHHERAHAARRDILTRLIARAGAVFMWPLARAQVLGALELAAEQSCDEVAASNLGDRLQVAEAILRVERLLQSDGPRLAPLAVEFGGDTVPQRVASLLEAPRRSGSAKLLAFGFISISSAVLAASTPLHHLTESLLETFVH